jgi:uncharacterized protein
MNTSGPKTIHLIVPGGRNKLAAMCKKHGVRALALFGSAASGEFDAERSDLDFVVEYEPQLPASRADTYFGLWSELEALFGRRVDLIERDAIRNPFFRQSVEMTQVTLYEAALTPRLSA